MYMSKGMSLHILGSVLVFLFVLFGLPGMSLAGGELGENRPKLGLALGGGSALGFAHIGVLVWLEEQRIPVDYVAGTSMGGLIGGCYAMGMSPEEIKTLVMEIDWAAIFQPNLPYQDLNFRRKEDRQAFPVAAELGLDWGKVKLPTGIFSYQVDFLLSRLTFPYSMVGDFADLPVSFSCVSADIERAEAVVMADGSLVEALRATMAVPGVFTPVLREGRLLVDGGLINNVPVDVVKEMGAHRTLAVELVPAIPPDRTGVGILARTINSVVAVGSRRTRELAEVFLSPEVADLTMVDWEKVQEFIDRGYQAAEEEAERLKSWAVDEETWAEYLRSREEKRRSTPVPEAVWVKGVNRSTELQIEKRLGKFLNQPVDTKALENELLQLLGEGLYESFRYECSRKEGRTVLVITVIPKAHGPTLLNFGTEIEAELLHGQEVSFALESRATLFNLFRPGTEARLDLRIGSEPGLSVELYQPLKQSSWFIAPTVFLTQHNLSLYQEEKRLSDYRLLLGGWGIDLGYTLSKNAEARFGYSLAQQYAGIRVGRDLALEGEGMVSKARIKFKYDPSDHPVLPRNGGNLSFSNTWFFQAPGAQERFSQSEARIFWTFPVAHQHGEKRDLIFIRSALGATWQGNAPFFQEFRLGGPFRLSAYEDGMLQGDNYVLGVIGYLKRCPRSFLCGRHLYVGIWWEEGATFDRWSRLKTEGALSLGLMGRTLFGPVYGNISFREDGSPYLYIGMGHEF